MKSERGLVERVNERLVEIAPTSPGGEVRRTARVIIEEVANAVASETRFLDRYAGPPGRTEIADWLRAQAQESEE